MAYGIMMENAGFKWYYSLLVSLTVYTGAYQFVLVTLLSSGASILTMALTAFLMNSRQSFVIFSASQFLNFSCWGNIPKPFQVATKVAGYTILPLFLPGANTIVF